MAATIPTGPSDVTTAPPARRLSAADLAPHPPLPWPPPRPAPVPPPAWYLDPWGLAALRWWDGRAWTGHAAYPAPGRTEPEPTLPVLPAAAGVAVLAALFVSLLFARSVTPALLRSGWPLLAVLGVQVLLTYGPTLWLSVAVARRYAPKGATCRGALALRFTWADIGWGVLGWLTIVFGNIVLHVVLRAVGIPFTSNVRGAGDGDGSPSRRLLLAMTMVAVVAAPLVEEIIFRGVVLRAARSVLPLPLAAAVQGVFFGLAHVQTAFGAGNLGLVIVLSWAGVCLGFLAHHFRRLGPSIWAHAAVNGVVFLLIWLAPTLLPRSG